MTQMAAGWRKLGQLNWLLTQAVLPRPGGLPHHKIFTQEPLFLEIPEQAQPAPVVGFMNRDPDPDLHCRLDSVIAEAHLQVRICQDQAVCSAERLAEAHSAMIAARRSLNTAHGLLNRVDRLFWWQLP